MSLDPLVPTITTNLGLIVVAAALFAILARKVHQPTVVGFLVAGLVLGPLLGVVAVGPFLESLADFGVALLLFLVGLELSFRELRTVGKVSVVAGLAQLAGSAGGGLLIALLFGFPLSVAVFLAFALAFSSTVVVVKILMDLGDLSETYGRLAVGIFLVQDLVIIFPLALIPVLGGAVEGPFDWREVAFETGRSLAATVVLVAGVFLVARSLLPPVFRWAAHHPDFTFLLAVAWLFLAVGATELLGVSLEVGAFAAGLSLSGLPYWREMRRRVHPVLHLFIALFFVSLGIGFSLEHVGEILVPALVFGLFVLVGNAVVLTLTLGLLGYPGETSFRTGVTVGQVSEFSFILAALAFGEGLIGAAVRDLVILVGMLTIAASAVLIWYSATIYRWLTRFRWVRRLPSGDRGLERPGGPGRDHVLVLGWDHHGPAIVRAVQGQWPEVRIVVISAHGDVPNGLPDGVEGVYAEPTDLEAMRGHGLDEARLVVANIPEPALVRVLIDEIGDETPVVARAETDALAKLFKQEGATGVLSLSEEVAEDAVRVILREGEANGRV